MPLGTSARGDLLQRVGDGLLQCHRLPGVPGRAAGGFAQRRAGACQRGWPFDAQVGRVDGGDRRP